MPLLHTKLNDVSGVSAAAARATLPEGIDVATAADKNTGHADDASANVPVRIRAELQACWTLGEQPARLLNSLVDDIVLCADAVLLVTQSGVLFSETTANKDSTLADTIGDSGGGGGRNKTLECQLLTRSRSQEGSEAHESLVLTTTTQQPPQEQVTGIIVLDALALCAPSYSLAAVAAALKRAARRQLAWLVPATMASENGLPLVPFHFWPKGLVHPVTAYYAVDEALKDDVNEMYLVEERRKLHKLLGIPETRPYFRTAQALDASTAPATSDEKKTLRLRDVHLSITSNVNNLPKGSKSLVDGSYDYYHYMQDGFNDNGWGCSYRSFQTLCSWVRLQNYGSHAVPSHAEIQQALVDLGDKDRTFVGSKQWIGSFEIAMLMDHYYSLACKIIHLGSGDEFPSKARELALHFQTEGSPVMIGGGVLAYTLLGIDYDETTGDVRFLILDPHYTGREDIATIISKGWCAWKVFGSDPTEIELIKKQQKPDLFLADAFYNVCLPQRPRMI